VKPPAFQCYADDLLSGTADMTAEEFGVYWRLICHSWNKGGLPNDDRRLALMAGQCSGNAVAHAKTKFRLCEDGLLRNDRLEQVRNEQELYRKNQSDKANLRWKKHRETGKTGATEPHAAALPVDMPEGCSPSPSPSPMDNKREQALPEANVPSWDEVKRMAEMQAIPEKTARAFYDHYESKNLWRNRFGVMINVLPSLIIWNNNERTGKTNGNGYARNPRPAIDRNAGTANAGKAGEYAAAARVV